MSAICPHCELNSLWMTAGLRGPEGKRRRSCPLSSFSPRPLTCPSASGVPGFTLCPTSRETLITAVLWLRRGRREDSVFLQQSPNLLFLLQVFQTRKGEHVVTGTCRDTALNPKLSHRASACVGVVRGTVLWVINLL